MEKTIENLSDAIFLTFYIRDGKAARDKGDEAGMDLQIDKVMQAVASGRISEAVGEQAVDKILHAPYNPNPTKSPSGCVVSGRQMTAAVLKSDPLARAKAQVEAAVKAGQLTAEDAEPLLAKIAEKVQERKDAHKASVLATLTAAVNAL